MKVASAFLVLLAATAVAASIPADDARERLHVVVARADRSHAAAALPLTADALCSATHLWVWTDRHPPRKFDVAASAPDEKQLATELARPPGARALDVRVRGWSDPRQLASVRVIAAPHEMWESVPEPLLPSFPVSREGRVTIPARGAVRIRVVGQPFGSVWELAGRSARSIDVHLRRPAADAELKLRSSDGAPLPRVFATVMHGRSSDATPSFQAQFAGDERGTLRIPSLPESEVLTLVLVGENVAPRMISGTAADLTREIRFARGKQVRGKFVDEENRPLAGVTVEAESWMSAAAPSATRNVAVSDASGRWTIGNLPGSDVAIRARANGRASFRRKLTFTEDESDLGTIALLPATSVKLTVADPDEKPLPGIAVKADSGFQGKTDAAGSVTLTGLAADEPAVVTIATKGFVTQTVTFDPPHPREEHVVLERAFSVNGRLVDESGSPRAGAVAILTAGVAYRRLTVEADGSFSWDVEAGKEFELTFESPADAPLTRKEPAGRAGEARSLGTIRLPAGLSVRGRVVDPSETPIVGVRIWGIRSGIGGTVASWVAGRIVQTTSDADGDFDLRGLSPGPLLLRFDAPDFARAHRDVVVEASGTDVGVVRMVRGRTVTVDAPVGATLARLDLRGEWLDADMLTAPVIASKARLRSVPPGRYKMTVTNGEAVVCERDVEVRDDADAAVTCPPPMNVHGRVLLGGTPAYGGALTWRRPSQTDALIDTRVSALGATQQRLYGLSGGMVVVPVRSDGTFETDELRPGEWQVVWRSADGVSTPDRTTVVPDAPEAQMVVEFSGGVIRGRVVDERGRRVSSARIREIEGPLFAFAGQDGSFTMTAVSPGLHRLQATLGAKASSVIAVTVEADKQTPEVTFQLDERERNVVTIHVVGLGGETKPNAFVFAESRGGNLRILTADASGVASGTFADGLPEVAKLVAFADNAWAFGELRRAPSEDEPQTTTIRFVRGGALRIRSRTTSGAPSIFSAQVPGDFSWMLGRIGTFVSLSPEEPLVIEGLPPGRYEVRLGSESGATIVTAGSTATIELR